MTRTTRDVTDENKEKTIITSTYLPSIDLVFVFLVLISIEF
jgi:hypothetical protein